VTDLRASDADRERTVAALRHHAETGRLTLEELDERCEQAYSAKTLRELAELQADLPQEAVRAPDAPRRRRRPFMPGRWGFTIRWHSPAPATVTAAELMAHVRPSLEAWGYDLTQRFDDRLRFEREVRPVWTFVLAVMVFPIGLLALMHKDKERLTIDIAETDRGTVLVASGVAPLAVRRAFAELED
jgi:uncharacterized protein DUF1707